MTEFPVEAAETPLVAMSAPLPSAPAPPPVGSDQVQHRIRIRSFTSDAAFALIGTAIGALAMTWVVYERMLPLSGALGFWLLWYTLFFVSFGAVTAMVWGHRAVADRVATLIMASAGLMIVFVIIDQVGYMIFSGWPALQHWNFFTQTMALTGETDPLSSGGVLHAIVGSLEQMAIATVIAVPLGLLAALFMSEVGGPMARSVRSLVEAMTSLPEIVAGLFIFALILLTFNLRPSGFAASLALTVMMVPFVARSSEVMLRLVPHNLREASYALGASEWRTTWNVVLPSARSGLTTGIVLGMARAIGETAPVLLTAGSSPYMNLNPLHNNQISLPLYIFVYVRRPDDLDHQRAFGAAVVLIAVVLVLFTIARLLGGAAPGELTLRQRRRFGRELRAGSASKAPRSQGMREINSEGSTKYVSP